MRDTLLTPKQKSEIISLIKEKNYSKLISILDSVSTSHAGTAKMKDKRFVIKEIVEHINSITTDNSDKLYYSAGKRILSVKSDNAKEIGIHIIWRGYNHNKSKVKKDLLKISDDKNWEVREYAAGAVTAVLFFHKEFYKTLLKWSKHKSENIRRVVVMSAVGLRGRDNVKCLPTVFALLKPLMYDSSVYVKKNLGPFILGSYFGNSFPEEVFKQLAKWSKIKDENVR
ncbi:MAG: hypothetical protein ABIO44_03185, partial [Saprospiraceae bacterium]